MPTSATSLLALAFACLVSGSGCIAYAVNADERSGARLTLYGSIEVAAPALIALAPLEDSRGEPLPYAARVGIWAGTALFLDGIVALIAYCGEPGRCKD